MQRSPSNYKLFCCNIGKINTDNLWRDNFEMFMASQLHNAFQVVVQFERHCWLSLAAGIFLHHIEWCCQNSVLLKTLQCPANKCPPTPTPSFSPMWGQTAESQLRHCGLPPSPATLEIATRKCRAPCQWRDGVASVASGRVNTHDPRLTFAVLPGAQTAGP